MKNTFWGWTNSPWFKTFLLVAAIAGCGGGGRDPILGIGGSGIVVLLPSVSGVVPLNAAAGVCPGNSVVAAFSGSPGFRLDPATVNATTFLVQGPAPATASVVPLSVTLDAASGRIATFKPAVPLASGGVYTATIKGGASGVKDMNSPPNGMAADYTWSFTVGAAGTCVASTIGTGTGTASILASAAPFGTMGGSAGMTNQGILTVVNGDIGTTAVSTAVTGFHDAGPGCTYTETGANIGSVTGKIYTAAPPPTIVCPTEGTATTFNIATQALADAQTAYIQLAGLPGSLAAANLAGLTLAPGVYTAPGGSFMIQGGDLTLDAGGDPNAVWVFQMATTLLLGGPGAAFPQSVTLANGAQAKNVYWQVGSAATINAAGGGTMVGTIIAHDGASFSTAGNVTVLTLNGRAISLNASVTLVNTVINVPAP